MVSSPKVDVATEAYSGLGSGAADTTEKIAMLSRMPIPTRGMRAARPGQMGWILQVEKKDQNQSSVMNKREELKLIKDLVNISTEHRKLAKHPLIEGLVMMKWKKIQVFWYVYMAVKFIFMVMFISLGIGTLGLKQLSCNYTDIDTESSNGKNAVL